MRVAVHQPQYIPWLGYFDKIARADCFVFLDNVQYKHREFQNRNRIRTKEGWMWLTVPVASNRGGKQGISQVAIDHTWQWQKKHLRSIEVWYGGSRFFDDHFPFFKKIYQMQWGRLIDINERIIRYILECLDIHTPLRHESEFAITTASSQRIVDICKALGADTYLSGTGGKGYLQEEEFAHAGINLEYQRFVHPKYRQMFVCEAHPFIPSLSALDLLFNEGAESKDIIRNCMSVESKKMEVL